MRPSLSCHHFGDRPSKSPPREPEARARKGAPPRSSATARRNWTWPAATGQPPVVCPRPAGRRWPRTAGRAPAQVHVDHAPASATRPPERPPHHDTQRLALSACVDCPAPLARCATPQRVREPARGTTERLARHPRASVSAENIRPSSPGRSREGRSTSRRARTSTSRPAARPATQDVARRDARSAGEPDLPDYDAKDRRPHDRGRRRPDPDHSPTTVDPVARPARRPRCRLGRWQDLHLRCCLRCGSVWRRRRRKTCPSCRLDDVAFCLVTC